MVEGWAILSVIQKRQPHNGFKYAKSGYSAYLEKMGFITLIDKPIDSSRILSMCKLIKSNIIKCSDENILVCAYLSSLMS